MPFVALQNVHLLIMYTMLVLMLILLHKGRKHPRSMVLALYALVEVVSNGFIYLNYAGGFDFYIRSPYIHLIYKPLHLLWAPLFYLYFRYSLSYEFRVKRKHVAHAIPFLTYCILFIVILSLKDRQYVLDHLYSKHSFLYILNQGIDALVKLQYIYYISLMIILLHRAKRRYRKNQTSNSSPPISFVWLQFIAYGYAIGCLGSTVGWVGFLFENPVGFWVNLTSTTYFFLFFFTIFYNTITQKQFTDRVRPKAHQLTQGELGTLMDRIDSLLLDKEMYLEPELTLQQIASALNEKERNVSHAINTIKKRNVNDYLNHLRVEHACKLLLKDKSIPIFEVMYSSGFNTKGAFNLAFKKIVGVTPTKYREGS